MEECYAVLEVQVDEEALGGDRLAVPQATVERRVEGLQGQGQVVARRQRCEVQLRGAQGLGKGKIHARADGVLEEKEAADVEISTHQYTAQILIVNFHCNF